MEAYKKGFSAVGFKCKKKNILTGVVNLDDAVKVITELTRDGRQVEIKFSYIGIIIVYNNFQSKLFLAWQRYVCFRDVFSRIGGYSGRKSPSRVFWPDGVTRNPARGKYEILKLRDVFIYLKIWHYPILPLLGYLS